MYGGYGTKTEIVKDIYYRTIDKHFEGRLNIVSEYIPAKHDRLRRIVGQGFTTNAVKAMEEKVLEHIKIFCTMLRSDGNKSQSEAVDLAKLANYLAFDIMTDNVYGQSFELLESSKNRYMILSLSQGLIFTHIVSIERLSSM